MTEEMKNRQGLRRTGYCVLVQYVNLDESGAHMDIVLRNASVIYQDHHSDYGQAVNIRVHDWRRNGSGDEPILDWLILYSPEVRMHGGRIKMRGFLQIVRRDGERVGPGEPEQPMRMVMLWLRPESGLDDKGDWLPDQPPGDPT